MDTDDTTPTVEPALAEVATRFLPLFFSDLSTRRILFAILCASTMAFGQTFNLRTRHARASRGGICGPGKGVGRFCTFIILLGLEL